MMMTKKAANAPGSNGHSRQAPRTICMRLQAAIERARKVGIGNFWFHQTVRQRSEI